MSPIGADSSPTELVHIVLTVQTRSMIGGRTPLTSSGSFTNEVAVHELRQHHTGVYVGNLCQSDGS